MNIFIGGAWPYANGSLHLGHIAALLPGDVLARYYRLKGEDVLYVSGSDCHGTPIALQAQKGNISPREITDKFHNQFVKCFKKLGFSYDLYTRTDSEFHHREVQEIFLELFKKNYIKTKKNKQLFCRECQQFLPDRYIEGTCPQCGELARGDQCDYCSRLIDPLELKKRKCQLCGEKPVVKESEQFYLTLSIFQKELEEYLSQAGNWRENAVKLTNRYLEEGLQERAVTRDLSWGIDIPLPGNENKKIYVWMDAVLGYFTASKKWARESGASWQQFWKKDNEQIKSYYIHGKDNIPFHSLILPALLLGLDDLKLPDHIISSEYLTIEGQKLSTSRNWAIWLPEIIDRYHPDSIRYFLIKNGPEKRDSDFSWEAFINSHNGELLGAFGNFVNRTLVFVEKYFSGRIPEGNVEEEIKLEIKELYATVGSKIATGKFKKALQDIFAFIRKANKYFDGEEPWITRKEERKKCRDTIFTCVQIIVNLADLLEPFLPFSAEKTRQFLNFERGNWEYETIKAGTEIGELEKLFARIDKEEIKKERKKLRKRARERAIEKYN